MSLQLSTIYILTVYNQKSQSIHKLCHVILALLFPSGTIEALRNLAMLELNSTVGQHGD